MIDYEDLDFLKSQNLKLYFILGINFKPYLH